MRGCKRGRLSERCHSPQVGETPLHDAVNRGHAAIVEQLLAAGAAVDAEGQVNGEGGRGYGRAGGQNTALRVLLFFLFRSSQNLSLSSLPELARELVTSRRCKLGNVTDSSAKHPNEI